MGILEKFKNTIESSELKRKKSHLKNLYSIAMADGKIRNEEFDFILHLANSRLYVDNSVLQNVINFPDDISFSIPTSDKERLDQIYDCVCLALVDGEINEKEISMCKLIAARLGYRTVIVDKIMERIIASIIKGVASEVALNKLMHEIEA